ncbi:MAG: vWA domain-containing protein [bacterium]
MKIEKIQEKIHRPKSQEQLGILVLDGSGSMEDIDVRGDVKAEAVARATKELIQRLKTSRRKDEIFLAIIVFDDNIELRLAPTSISEIDLELDLDPLVKHGGGTSIGNALDLGHQVANEFLANQQEGLPRDAIIILLSDGCSNSGTKDPRMVAEEIRQNCGAVIATASYGNDADKTLLREISSDPDKYFLEPKNGDELRDYFLSSIESIERA